MAWTVETAAFFLCIAGLLICMTVWELLSPGGAPRRGILAIRTTRGDRLFISLLSAAYIHLGWLALFGTPLWGATAVAFIVTIAVFRWV
jgi:predicted small integral membrane protein